ncbi:L-arabinose ABC transporter ATP-binding protein AraG [Eleftheria terrae]|uniref:L-arabinose ABC transporter ATP-binding protein AraG n=1 Tax=Eleftheria terrae TaxID=1597781 RepID=UPI00263A7D87|nr:L-arabinose ABC transporter ATP-binding protein AraG [Eleftheria terrae]
MTPPYLRFCNIGKSFPGVTALQHIDFGCREGSVHALMGENGAGKSTLLKILSGALKPSTGHLSLGGREVHFGGTDDALRQGVAIIYQELHLVPELTVAENLYLGQLPQRAGVVGARELRARAAAQLQRLGLDIDPATCVKHLSIGQRQMVEIGKALTRDAKVIAFDEPTSSLSAREIDQLMRVIGELKAEGRVVIYVSHRMEEVYRLCDEITVFKDGRLVRSFPDISQVSHEQLVQAMVGRDLGDIYGYAPRPLGDVRLQVSGFLAPGLRRPVDLSVRRGEVVGLFGLVGAGRTELMKGLFGATRASQGEIRIDGRPAAIAAPSDAIRQGLMLCPEDRKAEGIVPIHSVLDNINISARRDRLKPLGRIDMAWELANAQKMIRRLGIKTPSPHQAIQNLSGGNQQKAILGRWLSEDMTVMLLDEPTRGIDVGAKHEIYKVIFELAATGVAVLFASSDLPEALGLADRVLVMREGELVGELSHAEASEEKALALAMLGKPGAARAA